jgi:serine/threonine protein kinase
MHDPFDLSDAVIRDLPHVRVTRHAPQGGHPCEYRKTFKPEGLSDAEYWIERETKILVDARRLRHVVELSSMAWQGHGAPLIESVVTRDAGVTIEDWLRVRPKYASGFVLNHPFQHVGTFLWLLRACIEALKEIHGKGLVHCDIKPDNICLPFRPYPFNSVPGSRVEIDFEGLRLIDFTFSITARHPLERPLPIRPTARYQSDRLKRALRKDTASRKSRGFAAQRLGYRIDLYSLGYLAERILQGGLLEPAGPHGFAAMEGACRLVARLKSLDRPRFGFGGGLPHDALLEDIESLLKKLEDLNSYRGFEVAAVRAEYPPVGKAEPVSGVVPPQEKTPLATGDDAPPPRPPFPWRKRLVWSMAVAGIVGLSTVLAIWHPGMSGTDASDPAPEETPVCAGYSNDIKDYSRCRPNSSANPEGIDFKGAAGLPEWIKNGLNDAGVYAVANLVQALKSESENRECLDSSVKHLAGAYLPGVDFKWAHLCRADLRRANLRNADLRSAVLREADLTGAEIDGADFRSADLTGAIWTDGGRCGMGSIGKCKK